ncbi:hypothetical protein LAh9_11 [Aeromonas phage LAh_9]|uniref:Uncharacterized protein n=3 Tax=Lahexavirus TaxID=2843411 RepID=A0A514A196_9CAUD|nr:hypothetical protein HWC30_gp001 [Aeromonas phage LAh_6]YP_009847398.1 hypothetical protein HWC31_gp060 [Aeromonas phage LAh_8]YP_009847492.1 hypothetical protein HWC32_gp011 [Aeromonas phage LAh_9]QDH46640.1 hypothetical protein LAh6_1 [Aeromonas phage LAh_6]QDH46858.1 hypothetical protein LAh8_60 [Aeromonas phage LAh_8]QDH47005.1 hypothetical protein LAh9_11 [Aeromonas phage LAh_9]
MSVRALITLDTNEVSDSGYEVAKGFQA